MKREIYLSKLKEVSTEGLELFGLTLFMDNEKPLNSNLNRRSSTSIYLTLDELKEAKEKINKLLE